MTEQLFLSSIDYWLMALLAVGLPLWSYWDNKRDERKRKMGQGESLRTTYLKTYGLLWIPTMLVLSYWISSGRSFDVLGLSLTLSFAGTIGFGIVFILTAALIVQVFQAKNNKDVATKFMRELENAPSVDRVMPKTKADYRLFKGLSVTAGITEEIMFRGYLIWAFSFWMDTWLAALLSLAAFVLGHLYQGSKEAILKVALAGTALTLLYLLSGSLWLAILLHIVIDLTSGATCWHARKLTA